MQVTINDYFSNIFVANTCKDFKVTKQTENLVFVSLPDQQYLKIEYHSRVRLYEATLSVLNLDTGDKQTVGQVSKENVVDLLDHILPNLVNYEKMFG